MIICGTGHRPNKLGGYGPEVTAALIDLAKEWLESDTGKQFDAVISGGALGWDQAIAQAALDTDRLLTLALPFPEFWSKWPKQSQDYLEFLVSQAATVKYVCEAGYAPWKMQKRNEWMVDNSDGVLALWNGTTGGTYNCINYATKIGKPVNNLWESYENI